MMKFSECVNLNIFILCFAVLNDCAGFSFGDYIPEFCLLSSCHERRICDSVVLDYKGLEHDLNSKLYGQHIVIPTILKSIKGHMSYPEKPLVLSFHGSTGVGKNYVMQMIKDNMYKDEAQKHFHYFHPELHFKHKSEVMKYKDQLQSWIHHNVSKCGRSMFVFDEMDHMPAGIIDSITPYIGKKILIDGVDFRRTIFLFLSNIGGTNISKIAFEKWQNGWERKSLRLADLQHVLEVSIYNMKNGLEGSRLVQKSMIDHYVPFLPLERNHVRSCIEDFLERKNFSLSEYMINKALDDLGWYPNMFDLFAKTGCKKVAQLVFLML